ncbi:MAG TPA: DUF1049 domain-containing protein [Rhodanobacteraceae bacterium]|nr:DUF1049 domain-containing protein [Rhodanobacteraceae bacterium]
MRILWLSLIAVFALLGLLFGALNGERIVVDFYLFALTLPRGAALLAALAAGWLAGGALVYLGVVLRLRRQLREARRGAARTAVAGSAADAA